MNLFQHLICENFPHIGKYYLTYVFINNELLQEKFRDIIDDPADTSFNLISCQLETMNGIQIEVIKLIIKFKTGELWKKKN